MCIENGTDLNAAEEREEDIDTKDPSNGAFVVVFQLVFADVVVEYSNGIPINCLEF